MSVDIVDTLNDRDDLVVDLILTYKGNIMKTSVLFSGELIEDQGSENILDMWWKGVLPKITKKINEQNARGGGSIRVRQDASYGALEQ